MPRQRALLTLLLIQVLVLSASLGDLSRTASAVHSDANTQTSYPDLPELPSEEDVDPDWFDSADVLKPEFVPGEILVNFRESISIRLENGKWTTGIRLLDRLIEQFKVRWIKRIVSNVYKLKIPTDLDVLHVARKIKALAPSYVMYAEPNGIARTFLVPNDANYTQQWAHQMIKSEEAWNITNGASNVVIAVVDSGVDYNHPDLAANIWNNTDEIPDNGIDDDQNGFIDDVRGWDFAEASEMYPVYPGEDGTQPDNDPMDFLGHGTVIAGIAAAVTNNEIGIAGLTWNSKIMPVKSGYATYGGGALIYDQVAAGIRYAADNSADIITMSFGGTYRSKAVYDAIKYAYDEGALLVAAAGNNGERVKFYPAAYEEVVAVTATDQYDNPADFTNFGNWVEVAAPGVDILSTTCPNASQGPYQLGYPYDYVSGTSVAAPHVSGLAALIWGRFPNMTRDQVRVQLRRTAVDLPPEGFDNYCGYGRISAGESVKQVPAEYDLLALSWKLPFVSAPGEAKTVPFYPSGYNLLGSTQYASGLLTSLQSNNDVYMSFRSYATATSPQTLYAHQETTTIGGSTYYLQKLVSADAAGTSLSASMTSTGRQLLGKFVYPLTGVSSIPASTWTMYYRAWRDAVPGIAFDATSSGNNGGGSASVSWSHTTGSGSNRIMIVGVSIRTTSVSVSSITYGAQSLTFIRADTHASATIRSELWYLIAPASGTATVTVTLSGTSKATGGSVTYTGVAQTSPLDVNSGGTGTSNSPSQSVTVSTANSWLLGHLAITGSGTTVSAEGSGQTMRWDQVTSGGGATSRNRGHSSDKGMVGTGNQTMSWTLSGSADWAVSVVAFKPAPAVGHADVNILIRRSDGTIRTTIATNVANSADLTSAASTLSGTYAWASYIVVDQTDYLEIDYYVEVTTAAAVSAYLGIDDNSLAIADQTRASIYLPSEFTVEVEFTGSSNTEDWSQLVWTIDSSFTTESVTATFQLFNYTANAYPTSGDGYITATIGTTDETKTQTITTNPKHFRDAAGNWKIKVKGVKSTSSRFDWRGDLIKYEVTWPLYSVKTTVLNFGTRTVTGINVKLIVNGTEKDSERISQLQSGESAKVTCSWTPVSEGIYNVTTYVEPNNELSNATGNNAQFAYSWIRYSKTVRVPQDFPTIQEAIETTNLGIYGGDATILVSNGTYNEYDLLIQNMLSSLTLAGESSVNTTISGDSGTFGVFANVENVTIKGLAITNSYVGVQFWGDNCIASGNRITTNAYGIRVLAYYNNTVRDNLVSQNTNYGIHLGSSSGNAIINNTSSSNKYGLYMGGVNNTLVNGNTITSNTYGIWLTSSNEDVLTANTLTGNTYGFGIQGFSLSNFIHDINTTNTVDGKPIYYLVNRSNLVVDPSSSYANAGYLGLVNSTGITVRDLTLSKNLQGVMFAYTKNSNIQNVGTSNNTYGISFYYSNNTVIAKNTIADNYYGVYIWKSINNTITRNIVSKDTYGIYLSGSSGINIAGNNITKASRGISVYSSNGNVIYHNNLITNTRHVYSSLSSNSWDYGGEGNYWSGYTGTDSNGDGIGDTAYVIDASNQDRYPLIKIWGIYALNLRMMDWDLANGIQGAYVYADSYVKISDANGWANWTEISDRTVYVKAGWYGAWVSGTFLVVVDSNKTINIQSKIFDIAVTAIEGEQSAVLQYVNVTVYSATGSMIRSGITASDGKVYLTNVPNSTLTFTAYEGASSPQIIANVTRTITTENQAETIVCNQNYVSTSQEWSIIADSNVFSLSLAPLSPSMVLFPASHPKKSFSMVKRFRAKARGLKERVKTIRSKPSKKRDKGEGR